MGARPFLTSKLLEAAGLQHGFSLRTGGVSRGHFASLNLSHAVGDEAAAVDANLALLAGEARVAAFATAAQVHGDRVLVAEEAGLREWWAESAPGTLPANLPGEPADALVALRPGVAIGVRVADCVPVLLYEPKSGAAAAVHSGWRGARLGIAGRGARALAEAAGGEARGLVAAVGPCIGRCCYEVSRELASLFRGLFGPDVADDPAASAAPHLDLRLCVARSLAAAGVPLGRVEQVAGCTSCDAGAFFSHRRDRGRTGRHLAFAVAGRV
jgi:YfiH family protein